MTAARTRADVATDLLARSGWQPTRAHYETLRNALRESADLEHRWNVEASRAGFAGSEYVDDPERVFERVRYSQSRAQGFRSRAVKAERILGSLLDAVEIAAAADDEPIANAIAEARSLLGRQP